MKTVARILAVIVLVAVILPIARYRTVDPCQMLKKEMVAQVERKIAAARDTVRAAAGGLGEDAQRATDDIAGAVQNVAVGVASGVAAAKVDRMSKPACMSELVRTKLKGD
jgi:hypothetical protein